MLKTNGRIVFGQKIKLDKGHEHRCPFPELNRSFDEVGNHRGDDPPFFFLAKRRMFQDCGDAQQVAFDQLENPLVGSVANQFSINACLVMLSGEDLNRINNPADQPFLVLAIVDAFADLEGLVVCRAENIFRIEAEAHPLAEAAIAPPLAQ